MSNIKTTAVVAMSENNCIGQDNDLPWHIPEDLKHFKAVTMGKPVIMGRKTFESIFARLGKPLPGRANIIISRGDFQAEGVTVCKTIEAALAHAKDIAREQGLDEVIIGGGAMIYDLALPYTDKIELTKVHTVVNGDAFFPQLDESWQQTAHQDHEGDPSFSFITLEKQR